eukprot:8120089-Alexandrium_andersonii.AAC.1
MEGPPQGPRGRVAFVGAARHLVAEGIVQAPEANERVDAELGQQGVQVPPGLLHEAQRAPEDVRR